MSHEADYCVGENLYHAGAIYTTHHFEDAERAFLMRETVSGRARVQVITASQVEMYLLQYLLLQYINTIDTIVHKPNEEVSESVKRQVQPSVHTTI